MSSRRPGKRAAIVSTSASTLSIRDASWSTLRACTIVSRASSSCGKVCACKFRVACSSTSAIAAISALSGLGTITASCLGAAAGNEPAAAAPQVQPEARCRPHHIPPSRPLSSSGRRRWLVLDGRAGLEKSDAVLDEAGCLLNFAGTQIFVRALAHMTQLRKLQHASVIELFTTLPITLPAGTNVSSIPGGAAACITAKVERPCGYLEQVSHVVLAWIGGVRGKREAYVGQVLEKVD
eukprot:scaffold221630_cov30-Tisochrysis_lutea.AAC.3